LIYNYLKKNLKKLILILFFIPQFCFSQQTIFSNVVHDNLSRDYIIYVPLSYDPNIETPLVFSLHGKGGNSATNMSYTNFNSIADTANFIVIYPQGALDLNLITNWNVGDWIFSSGVDDIGFIDTILEIMSFQYNIDSDRVYSTGFSNGGFMSFSLACQLSDKIAAIAAVAGSMTPFTYNNCNPLHPTPVLQIHGTNDIVVPYDGDPSWTKSVDDVLEFWRNYNNCSINPYVYNIPDINMLDLSTVDHFLFENGNNGVTTEHFKVYNGGHDWPGVWGNFDINASNEIWNFFSKYDINGLISANTNINPEINFNQKQVVNIFDFLGRTISVSKNTPLFYLYNDGSLEKKMITY
tara:strand:- start:224 stop:1279 length:1056 start_codon:yes stop_codon:yes gene_type:complete